MYIVIIGCTMVGRKIARQLSIDGNDVVVIDNNVENISKLRNTFDGQIVESLDFDKEILESIKIKDAKCVVVCTDDDNKNIMTAQVLNKIFGITNIVLSLESISMSKLYNDSPFNIICPTSIVSDKILDSINKKEK